MSLLNDRENEIVPEMSKWFRYDKYERKVLSTLPEGIRIQEDADELKVYLFSRLLLAYVLLSMTVHFDHAALYDYARYDYDL